MSDSHREVLEKEIKGPEIKAAILALNSGKMPCFVGAHQLHLYHNLVNYVANG